MNQLFRFRHAPRALVLAIAAITASQAAHAATDLRQRLNVRQDASEIVLGETMYQFYQDNRFAALNNILLAKSTKWLNESNTTSETLLGDLYTAFGMPDAADTVFSRIIVSDMRTQTRNVTVFRKARLQYQRGDFFEAERALNVPLDSQITELEAERRIMLANVLMGRNEFVEARNILSPIPLNTEMGAYATYNMGVAHLRADRSPEGIRLLEQVMNLPAGSNETSNNETNALKDRAALAIGYDFLQTHQPDKARDALVKVRLQGPFSNRALLALGHAQYEIQDYKRALSFWLELVSRNPGDPAVQEAMILAPRAYEALKANQQAFYGYKLAITNLNSQIDLVNKTAEKLKDPAWLDQLRPASIKDINADAMAVPASVIPTDATDISLLYGLFTGHAFNEGFQQYEQLKRLKLLLQQRGLDLQAMRDVNSELAKRKARMPALTSRVDALQSRLTQVAERWPTLDKRARQAVSSNNAGRTGGAANLQTMERQFKLGQMESKLAAMPDNPARQALANRVRVLKGLVMVDIASKVAPSRDQVYADIASNETQLRLTQLRAEALKQLLADNQKVLATDGAARIQVMEARLQTSHKALDKALDEYRRYLLALASNQLEDTRSRINNDLAEAHLSIARLQDASLARDDAPTGTRGK